MERLSGDTSLVFSQLYLSPILSWAVTSASAFAIGVIVGPWAIASQVAANRALRGEGRDTVVGSGRSPDRLRRCALG